MRQFDFLMTVKGKQGHRNLVMNEYIARQVFLIVQLI